MTKHSLLHIVSIILLLSSICFFSSCNEEEIESFETEVPASTHTCRMTFDVDFTGFDVQDGSTRASIHGWDNGDVVYLSFTTSGNGTVGGSAIYDATNNDWTVTYTGTLSSTEQGSVKVFYYDGDVTKTGNTLTIEPTIGVYADLKGSYKYSRENGVNVSASLSPQASRIRFKGEPGKTITVSGIKSYTEYDQQSGVIASTPISSSVAVSSDGFTPYIYGFFADTSKPSISINSEGCKFTKDCNSSVFQIGESGWMNVPTRVAHDKWEMEDLSVAYAVATDTDKDGVKETLIFYYDDVDRSQEGFEILLNEGQTYPSWYSFLSKDITNVIFDPTFALARPTSTYCWFSGFYQLTSISGLKYLDTSEVIYMDEMFSGCMRLTSLDLCNFNTSAVTSMTAMFASCKSLSSIDLSRFNTEAVTDMHYMFSGCSGLTSLDLGSFNTTAVTNMKGMFNECSSLTSLDLSNFNTAAVTNMRNMFYGCSGLTSLDLSDFNTVAVTDMSGMFSRCSSLTSLDISNFNTEAVTDMSWMFQGCSGLTSLDVSHFNTANVTNMLYMFDGCSGLTSLDVSHFNTAAVTNMYGMFQGCSSLANLDVSGFNTAAVTNMHSMFDGCSSLTSLDVSHFNTAAVIDMTGMFDNCSRLTNLDFSNFDVSAETSIYYLLWGCNNLSSIYAGSNDFTANDATNTVFEGVGHPSKPCNLIINSGFDKSVLGRYIGSYYYWRGGYFTEPTIQN